MSADELWLQRRRAGVLLHPTSLPGPEPGGGMGPEAEWFVDFLAEAGFGVWQMLPVGPVHEDRSPYNAQSSFAGHTGLLSARRLREKGLVGQPRRAEQDDLDGTALVADAWDTFRHDADAHRWSEYEDFLRRHVDWLDEYALFRAIRADQGHRPWYRWPRPLRRRDAQALEQARREHGAAMDRARFGQFLFFTLWGELRDYAAARGVELFGDIPIYVAHDSADTWCWREFFTLDVDGRRQARAGVPPDAFTDTGQLWGNPLYRWSRLAADGYRWWIRRFEVQCTLFSMLRIDHFRGFDACWKVPGGARTAEGGHWEPGPGRALFDAVSQALGSLRLVAEDLGEITPSVEQLRRDLGLPGMRVLQFAFDGEADNPHLPANIGPDAVVYTGTHDNDTTLGWWKQLTGAQRERVCYWLGTEEATMPETLIQTAMNTAGRLAMVPMQDLLGLDSRARMNTPGTARGNWHWRLSGADMPDDLAQRSRRLLAETDRLEGDASSWS